MIYLKKTFMLVLILSGFIFLFSCFQPTGDARQNLPKSISGLTPENWKLYDTIKQFTPENLYEHINGRAEFFIAYDLMGMTYANFVKNDLNGPFIDLFIYDMGNPTNAFGVFSAERSNEGTPLKIGRDAYRQDANYYVWKGKYYITVIASETSAELEAIGKDLAEKASHALNDSGDKVWGLSALPQKDLVAGSIKFVKTDAMGLDFMKNTYMAQYRKYNINIKHFLSHKESEKAADDTVKQYADFAIQYGNGTETKAVNGTNLIVCDMEDYVDVVFQKGSLVAGVLSVKEKEVAVKAAMDMFHNLP